MTTKPIIGILGGIGSGKSLVAAELAKRGGHLIVGDHLGHEALRQADIKAKVISRWGKSVLDSGGEIDRRVLGRIVFAEPKELQALEEIVFPYIGRRIAEEIAKAKVDDRVRFVVVDAAVMVEAGWAKNCDRIVFVEAPREIRFERLRTTRGWSEQELERRESAQISLEEKRRRADAIIDNSGTPERLHDQIEQLLRKWETEEDRP